MNIQEFSNHVVGHYSSKLYGVYMVQIHKAMENLNKGNKLSGIASGFLIISGDSLLAARYRELSDSSFERDGIVLVGLEKEKIQESFDSLTRKRVDRVEFGAGIPLLIFYRGDHELRYLDFQIDDLEADKILDGLPPEYQERDEVRKVFASVRRYHDLMDNSFEEEAS